MAKITPEVEFEDIEIVPQSEMEQEVPEQTDAEKELEQLRKQADTNQALSSVAEALKEQVGKPQQPVVGELEKKPGETEDQFQQRVNETIFTSPNPMKVIQEIVNRTIAPVVGQFAGISSQQAKKLLFSADETKKNAKKYKKEIEDYVASLPAQQRQNPGIWDHAYDQVVNQTHREDLINDQVEDIVSKRVQAELAKLGIQVPEQDQDVMFTEGSGTLGNGPSRKVPKKKLAYTPEDERKAELLSMNLQDYLLYVKPKKGA